MSIKSLNFLIYSIWILWIILALVFAFTDLRISMNVVNTQSPWANFLERYGEIPGLVTVLFGIFIYSHNYKSKFKVWRLMIRAMLIISGTGVLLYLSFVALRNINGSEQVFYNNLYLVTSLCLFIAILFIHPFNFWANNTKERTFNIARLIVLTALAGYLFCIQLLKFIWGRVRFRDLNGALSDFSPWYLPQGFTENVSFPSGHAAMGWMLLPLILFVADKNQTMNYIILTVMIIWGFAVSMSRVVIGAHYASDVLFGSFFIITAFLILYKKYFCGKGMVEEGIKVN